jgi:hypothetical protein
MKAKIENITNKILSWIHINKNIDLYAKADYFNGSSNDAENIFIELKKLVSGGHCHHGKFFYDRLNFLINEGIDVTNEQTVAIKKLMEAEVAQPKKIAKAKPSKKVVKKAVKKTYKPKRDRHGRFIARR